MPSFVIILLLAGASGVLGWSILRRFPVFDGDGLAWLIGSVTVGVVVLGTMGLLLAQLGLFSILALAVLWLLLLLLCLLIPLERSVLRKHVDPISQSSHATQAQPASQTQIQYLLLVLWLPLAVWLFFRPHEYILGAADAGVYVNLGASIAKTGQILIENDFLLTLPPALQTAVLRPVDYAQVEAYLFPAFYVADLARPNQITPQFYPAHPIWMAMAFGLASSVETAVWAELFLPGLWAVLGVLAVYLTVRQFAGWPIAMLALAGLTINGMQVWFARYPVTETFAQFLLWAGLWAAGGWLNGRQDNRLWALISALALGQSFLLRIDAVFMLPILGLLGLWLWLSGQWKVSYNWFFVPLCAQIAYALTHALWQSRPYFFEVFGHSLAGLQLSGSLVAVGLVLGLAALFLLSRWRGRLGPFTWLIRPFLVTLVLLIVVATCYLWFVRPGLGQPDSFLDPYSQTQIAWYDHENLLRLSWYLSPVTIWFGAAGIALMVWRVERKTVMLLAICGLFTAFYLWSIRSNPVQIYTMRRYLAATMPLFVVGTAVFLGFGANEVSQRLSKVGSLYQNKWLGGHLHLLVGAVLALFWLANLGWAARGFLSQIDLDNFIAQVAEFDAELDPNAILIFNERAPISNGDTLGTPLHFLYGHDVLTLRNWDGVDSAQLAATIQQWQANGRSVYWAGDPNWLETQNIPYTASQIDIENRWLELVYTHKPQEVISVRWRFPLAALQTP